MKYVNKKLLLMLSISGMVLLSSVACSNKKEDNNSDEKTVKESVTNNIDNIEETNNDKVQNDNITTEEQLLEYIFSIKEDINTYLESEDVQEYKDVITKKFIIIVDFIFFEGQIGEYKFSDLTDETKQKVLEIATDIDSKIEIKYPNYKEGLSEKYENISSKIKIKYNEISKIVLNKLKEQIGEQSYDDLEKSINDAQKNAEMGIDYTKEQAEKVKEKTLDWYQNLKNKY